MATMAGAYFSAYLDTDQLKQAAIRIITALKPHADKFDSIAFRGMSGAIIAPIVAFMMQKHIIMVRKERDGSHSGCRVEGFIKSKSYVIVDDFVGSGRTCFEVIHTINQWQSGKLWDGCDTPTTPGKCYGIALYNDNGYPGKDEIKRILNDDNLVILKCKK